MNLIEFIGASGIGKTTLLKTVLSNRKNGNKWYSLQEAKIDLVKQKQLSLPHLKKIYKIFFKIAVFKSAEVILTNKILNSYLNDVLFINREKYKVFISTFLNQINSNVNLTPIQKIHYIHFDYHIILDYLIFDHFDYQHLILIDEGLIHNNLYFLNETNLNTIRDNDQELIKNFKPRALIYCSMDEKAYLTRKSNRINVNQGNFIERGLSQVQIENLCKGSLSFSEKQYIIFKNFGIPILILDMGISIEINSKKVRDFILAQKFI